MDEDWGRAKYNVDVLALFAILVRISLLLLYSCIYFPKNVLILVAKYKREQRNYLTYWRVLGFNEAFCGYCSTEKELNLYVKSCCLIGL